VEDEIGRAAVPGDGHADGGATWPKQRLHRPSIATHEGRDRSRNASAGPARGSRGERSCS
jgi:hypothetical protein